MKTKKRLEIAEKLTKGYKLDKDEFNKLKNDDFFSDEKLTYTEFQQQYYDDGIVKGYLCPQSGYDSVNLGDFHIYDNNGCKYGLHRNEVLFSELSIYQKKYLGVGILYDESKDIIQYTYNFIVGNELGLPIEDFDTTIKVSTSEISLALIDKLLTNENKIEVKKIDNDGKVYFYDREKDEYIELRIPHECNSTIERNPLRYNGKNIKCSVCNKTFEITIKKEEII